MKKDSIYKIYINKDLYFEVLYDGYSIELIDAGNIPEENIKIVNLSDKSFITIGDIPYMNVDLTTGEIQYISSNVLTTYVRNYSQTEREKDPATKVEHLLNKKQFLLNLKREYKIDIAAAHINHMIRGDDADKDESFCENICKNAGVEFYKLNINIPEIAKLIKTSEENAGRIERYKFFNKICNFLLKMNIQSVSTPKHI